MFVNLTSDYLISLLAALCPASQSVYITPYVNLNSGGSLHDADSILSDYVRTHMILFTREISIAVRIFFMHVKTGIT